MTGRAGLRVAAAVACCLLPRLPGREAGPDVEHALFSLPEPAVTFSRTFPLSEGDGNVEVEIEARINPDTELEEQPGGWWHYLEFQDATKRYLTGVYKGPKLTAEPQTFRQARSYIPAGTCFVRVGVGAKGKTYQLVTSLRVVHRRPAVRLTAPADGATLHDNTPRLEWASDARRFIVEMSSAPTFPDAATSRARVVLRHQHEVERPLDPGTWYWRVTNLDGAASRVRSFVQTAPAGADTSGPVLDVPHQYVTGRAEPLAVLVDDAGLVRAVSFEAGQSRGVARLEGGRAAWAPAAGWEKGLTSVRVRAEDEHGNTSERLVYVAHADRPPARVTWTRHQGVHIERRGEPLLPLAMYMVRDFEMPRAKAAGVNLVQHYGADGADTATTREWLRAAHANGLKAFVAFDRARLAALDLEFVAERVASLMAEPALLAWYLFDEPELASHGLHPFELEAVTDLIHSLDPFHPVLLTCYHEHYISEYSDCFDAFLTQAYHTDPLKVRGEAVLSGGLLTEHGRMGSVIVRNYLPNASFESNRCAAFLAAMYQTGVFWWGWWDDYRLGRSEKAGERLHERFSGLADRAARRVAFETEMGRITGELAALAPVFTGPGKARTWEDGDAAFWLKETDGAVWLIAANAGADDAQAATGRLPELEGCTSMRRRRGDSILQVADAQLTIRLEPHEVAVFTVPR